MMRTADPSSMKPYSADMIQEICISCRSQHFNDTDTNFVIINNPSKTLGHKMMGMDIEGLAKQILSYNEQCSRENPLFAIVTGVGRGKTRTLVELNKELNKNKGVLSIPITFNHNWGKILKPTSSNAVNYALAIVSRIISMHYHCPLDDVHRKLGKRLQEYDFDDEDAIIMIQDCIRCIVSEERKKDRHISKFVLLVDESKRCEDVLGNDVHSYLRDAILSTELIPNEHLSINLVMSSLDIKSTGASSSGRPIFAITTPTSLDADEVLHDWVARSIPLVNTLIITDEVKKLKILSLIACFSRMPRAIEIFTNKLGAALKDSPNATFDGEFMQKLYNATFDQISLRYPGIASLPPTYAEAVLFKKSIKVDDKVMDLVAKSVFTNSLRDLGELNTIEIVPETSILSIQLACRENVDSFKYAKEISVTIKSLLSYLASDLGREKVGRPLEIIMRGLINSRLKVLLDVGNVIGEGQTISLLSLFGVKDFEEIKTNQKQNDAFIELVATKINIRPLTYVYKYRLENSYYNPSNQGK